MISTVELRRATSIIAGALSSVSASALISSENVAENSRFCRRFGKLREDALDVADEAHVEHPVGLVQHQDLDVRKIDGALLVMIEQPARRRDQDVDPAFELRDLRINADAAEHHRRSLLRVLAVDANAFLDLRGEFARRGQDQRAHRLAPADYRGRRTRGQPLQDRQHESGGLAGAGLRAREQIAAREHRRYGLHLDRRGRGVAVLGHRAYELLGQAELGE